MFGGLCAVNQLDLQISPGEIHGLIGPNGSGKTTTLNLLSGLYQPTEGKIYFNGVDITSKKPHERTRIGIARTFQTLQLFDDLTVLDNVMIGRHCRTKAGIAAAGFRTRRMQVEEQETRLYAMELLDVVGLKSRALTLAGNLPYGEQRMLEIGRALATEPRVLLVDEPAAGLNPTEIRTLIGFFRHLKAKGVTVLLIEHRMEVIMQVCDLITVLDYGGKIAAGSPKEIQNDVKVQKAYLGRAIRHA